MSLIETAPEQPKLIAEPAAIDRRTGKPKQLSKRARTAVRMILSGEAKTHKEAAEHVKLSAGHLSELIHSPAGRAFIARERSKTITLGSLRAAARLVDLVDATSEHVSLDASRHLLAIEGVAPPDTRQPLVNVNITPGYVIDLGGKAQTIEHEAPAIMSPTLERKGIDG